MPTLKRVLFSLMLFAGLALFFSMRTPSQTNVPRTLIMQRVDETKLTVLHGNTHPLARAEFDRGAAPASLPLDNIYLVLKRSPEQEAALEKLLAEQQDPSSPNYHNWLTPEQFGQQFGPGDQDIQTVTSWLQSHGFTVNQVSKGRTLIDFSGTAAQVPGAFHTEIHKYVVNGEEHWANASDPQIPEALTPAVAGVKSLHNFFPKPMNHSRGLFSRSKATGEVTPINPEFTFLGDCYGNNTNCYALGPYDFATIYNVLPLWNAGIDGTGQTIAVIGDSNINLADVANFRNLFGLPANIPQVIIPPGATNPGVQASGDEIEADLDVEWSGGVAKNATIDLVIAANTNTMAGVDIAAQYVINNNVAPIMSESFGQCELLLETSANQFYNNLWQQGAAEGITVIVATGDNGSAGCDIYEVDGPPSQPAELGLQVSGLASTPYNVAVGGTDFASPYTSSGYTYPSPYFNSTNGSNEVSAKGYVPETTWNDSCTNALFVTFGYGTNAQAACNSHTLIVDGFVTPVGGSGGVSNCTAPTGSTPASCAGGYPKPSWQTGIGVPNDGKRDLPDVSLFAGDGFMGSFYVICEQDANPAPYTNTACNLNSPFEAFSGVGGTSVSTQVFAGIMALIDQKIQDRQGNANPVLYTLAASQSASSCNASNTPASNCIFNDVTSGTNAGPCLATYPNCTITGSNSVGILETSGALDYNAGTGYDLATGLGSVNAANLVNAWVSTGTDGGFANFVLSSSNATATVSSPGNSGMMPLTITAHNGFTGTINITCSNMPTGSNCSGSVTFTSGGPTSISTTVMVTTTASSKLVPSSRRGPLNGTPQIIALLCVFYLGFLLIGLSSRQSRWNMALTLVIFSLLVVNTGCGGGGSSGGGGGSSSSSSSSSSSGATPVGQTTPIVVATSGNLTRTFGFTLNVQ